LVNMFLHVIELKFTYIKLCRKKKFTYIKLCRKKKIEVERNIS